VDAAVAAIRAVTDLEPEVVIVLGSGLGSALPELEAQAEFPFSDLPGFPPASVQGHEGRLALGRLAGVQVGVFFGRIHFYEHRSMSRCSLTSRLAAALGARTMVLTASVGGLDSQVKIGATVIIADHVNLMGTDPLEGWRFADGSPAFVDVSSVWDPVLAELAERCAREIGLWTSRGIYAAVAGPTYETPSEAEFLRRTGATVVGMSMVPEAVAAHALGMKVLGVATVANAAGVAVDHTEVLQAGMRTAPAAGKLLEAILCRPNLNGDRYGE
jgi:purine-nucleoside phosphorylase